MQEDERKRLTDDLIQAVGAVCQAEIDRGADRAGIARRIVDRLPRLHLDPEASDPAKKPVCRHLHRALELGEAGPARDIARLIRKLEPTLHWRQNPKYTAESRGAEFMENYAFTDFGVAGSTALYIGAVLLGPGITYEPTKYVGSEGVFIVVGGSPDWKAGDDAWRRVEAGSVIPRGVDGSEGKRPGREPMLAIYAWHYPGNG